MFDPSFKPSAASKPLTPEKHWRNFVTSVIVCSVLLAQVFLIYAYVDKYIQIP